MPPRNYDTTASKPYPRVTAISIRYPTNGVPLIDYVEQMAIVDGDGMVQHLEGGSTSHSLDLSQITQPVQAVDPATGADIPGLTFTSNTVMLGLLAFLRTDQKRREGA